MAETAKILSYDKTVLIPDEHAGCSLADTITADQLRAWKAEHPGAVVVSYVNTTAAVKAETDICCTSSNAVEVVAVDPRATTRCCSAPTSSSAPTCSASPAARTCTSGWASATCTPASTAPTCGAGRPRPRRRAVHPPRVRLRHERAVPRRRRRRARPSARKILSTGGHGRRGPARRRRSKVLVATETGMLHQLRKANPLVTASSRSTAPRCAST